MTSLPIVVGDFEAMTDRLQEVVGDKAPALNNAPELPDCCTKQKSPRQAEGSCSKNRT